MRSHWLFTSIVMADAVYASDVAPISLAPGLWKGMDGNWSTVSLAVGSNSQHVNLLYVVVSRWTHPINHDTPMLTITSTSGESICGQTRGGTFDVSKSKSWEDIGSWQLGLSYLEYGGNGEYGFEQISANDTSKNQSLTLEHVLTASYTTTNYINGLFGLGITSDYYQDRTLQPPLYQAVAEQGLIPSYSFGYTAGASYRNQPQSLTIGGVDKSRYQDHNEQFNLTGSDKLHRALVRGIQIHSTDKRFEPSAWTSPDPFLSTWDTAFTAHIDSSTSYLWLPEDVCEAFAKAFNLTFIDDYQVYEVPLDQYQTWLYNDQYHISFMLSSAENNATDGDPYSSPGVVNITLPIQAFIGLLNVPFNPQAVVNPASMARPYFMLRKTRNNTPLILGRVFLQEAYMISKYDEGTFSIHQAKFSDPEDAEIVAIERPDNSSYPPPGSGGGNGSGSGNGSDGTTGLTQGQIAGIVIGIVLFIVFLAALVWWCRRRGYVQFGKTSHESKDEDAVQGKPSPWFSEFSKKQQPAHWELEDRQTYEAPNTQIHEMSAPEPIIELDGDTGSMWDGDMDETQHAYNYEVAKERIQRQLQGPVPEYTPTVQAGLVLEKGAGSSDTKHSHESIRISPSMNTHDSSYPTLGAPSSLGSISPTTLTSPVQPWDSLGSNFTLQESVLDRNGTREHTTNTHPKNRTRGNNQTAASHDSDCIHTGSELVHIPQRAARRYSWEID